MKRILIFLIALAVMLSACISVGPAVCVEDNVCTNDEKFKGGCFDCQPDFSIDSKDIDLYFDQQSNTVNLHACIVNTGGEYTDRVNVQLNLYTRDQSVQDNEDIWVYFNEQEGQGKINVDVREGEIIVDNFFRFRNGNTEDQYSCFSHQFENVAENTYYSASVYLDWNNDVAERDENNNKAKAYLEGTAESYSEFLIESDVSEYMYSYSERDAESYDGLSYVVYQARYGSYDDIDASFADAYVVTEFAGGSADDLLELVLDDADFEFDEGLNVYVYYDGGDTGVYMWTSGDVLVFIELDSSETIVGAYLDRYPSDLANSDFQEFDFEAQVSIDSIPVSFGQPHILDSSIEYADLDNRDSIEVKVTGDLAEMNPGDLLSVTGDGLEFEMYLVEATEFGGLEFVMGGTQLYHQLNEPKTVTVNGNTYEVEIVGGNDEFSNIIVSVNGVRETLEEGDTERINGLDIYVQDLFVTTIPTDSASANLIIGAQDIYIDSLSYTTESCDDLANYGDVEINNDDLEGVSACVQVTDGNPFFGFTEIRFLYDTSQFDIDNDLDDIEYLGINGTVDLPLFDVSVLFHGEMRADTNLDSQSLVSFEKSGNDVAFTATNILGQEFEVDLLQEEGNEIISGDDFGYNLVHEFNVTEGDILLLNLEQLNGEIVSSFVEVYDIDHNTNALSTVTMKNLATGVEKEYLWYDVFDESSNVGIEAIAPGEIRLTEPTDTVFYAENGVEIILYQDDEDGFSSFAIEWSENYDEADNLGINGTVEFDSSSNEIIIDAGGISSVFYPQTAFRESDDDLSYALSRGGYYAIYDSDDQSFLELWSSSEPAQYNLNLRHGSCSSGWQTYLYGEFSGNPRSGGCSSSQPIN